MKSTTFRLDCKSSNCTSTSTSQGLYRYEFVIPILEAYAIDYFLLNVNGLSGLQGSNDTIEKDKLSFNIEYSLDDMETTLVIYYHGIRDYSLLFPGVSDVNLKQRLGEFYREAELNFDNGSWLSFALMCGALFEGILYNKLNQNDKFHTLISKAFSYKLIDKQTKDIMNSVRSQRNLVHANMYQVPYITRADAFDIRKILDKLIKET